MRATSDPGDRSRGGAGHVLTWLGGLGHEFPDGLAVARRNGLGMAALLSMIVVVKLSDTGA